MLAGMIVTRALLPQVVLETGDLDAMNEVAIDEWMGASPVYTRRMRQLMGIEGDRVDAIMKALQLDVGFVHQYMHVGYRILDDDHAEFWLEHCGALLDTEPHGEERVVGMCHTIEDPTFDATALATNPRARIRPIHRPPRRPADRHPHCHWTIAIEDDNDPVGAVPLTDAVAASALADVPNTIAADLEPGGRRDYAGAFDPTFQLSDLSQGTLAAVSREFQAQAHLLMCSSELTLRDRVGADTAHRMIGDAWAGAGWIASERLRRVRPAASPLDALGRHVRAPADAPTRLRARRRRPGRRPPGDAPGAGRRTARRRPSGLVRLAGRRGPRGVAAMAHGVDRHAQVSDLEVAGDEVRFAVTVEPDGAPAAEPDAAALVRIGMVSVWDFDTTDRIADPTRH